jgi:hypothetical protein
MSNYTGKKLKVFGVPWHVAHQWELAKLGFMGQYDLIINPYRTWGTSHRPFPPNANWVTHYEKGKYDLAILHVDQQSIYNPEMGDRIHKGKLYLELREAIGNDVPIITINHMTPFHDKYESPFVVDFIKKMTAGTTMVCNSYTAQKQWGWGEVIIHGMDPNEWRDLPKEPRCVTVLSPAGMEKAYRRIFLTTVKRMLDDMGVPYVWVGVDRKFESFEAYRDFLGRSLVFFMPTWQSPRPRARTEAMFSGCCIVTTPYQDADTFIRHGENGFLTSRATMTDPRIMDNPETTAQLIKRLVIDEPDLALRVGQEGKKTANELFTMEKFEDQWINLLKKINVL